MMLFFLAWRKILWQSRGIWVTTPLVTTFILLMRGVGILQFAEWQAYDAMVRTRPRTLDDRIVIVGITEADVSHFETSIFSDAVLAKLINQLKAQQPVAIGLDLYRNVPVPPGTETLHQVYESTPNLIGIEKVAGTDEFSTVAPPPILQQANQVGANDVVIDRDNVIRRGFVYLIGDDQKPHYSFGLHLAIRYLDRFGIGAESVPDSKDDFKLGNIRFSPFSANSGGYINADASGFQLLLQYERRFEQVSLTEVLAGRLPPDWGKDKIILIGKVGESFKDMHYTPYSHFWGGSRAVPGVEIHGNLVSQFIGAGLDDRRLITSLAEPWEWLWIGGWTFLGALITWQWRYSHQHRWKQWKTSIAMAGSGVVLVGSSYGALILGVWLPVVPPLLGLLGASGFIVTWMAQAGLQVRNTFGRYLTDQVVATLLENPEGLKMGGERRTITLLTSDLRGFTSTSETLTPEKVVSVLNLYFGAMADVITRYGGTIDEFMGDGILVLFGAPTAAADDALRAVACAVDMQLAIATVNQEMAAMNLKPLEMGIGINTGEVVVGNIGSEKRTKYGVVGAQVNLTYRIESYTIGGQILISQTTLEQAGDTVQVAGSQTVHPKGVSEPVVVWDVMGVGQPYSLALTKETECYIKLDPPLTVTYACLVGKHVSKQHCYGQLSQLSQQGGFVKISPQQPRPDPHTNLKIEIGGIEENGSATTTVYAKVIEPPAHPSADNAGFYLYFSAMPTSLTQQLKKRYQAGQVVFPGTSTAQ